MIVRTVHLHGYLGEKYGKTHKFAASTVKDVCRALQANYKDFYPNIVEGKFHVVRGEDLEHGDGLDENQLEMRLGSKDLHIVPVIAGSSGKGIFSIVLGIALIAVAIFVPPVAFGAIPLFGGVTISGVTLGLMGGLMVLGGISQMLSSTVQDEDNTEESKDNKSFIFDKAVNVYRQGGPVPLCYGIAMLGCTCVSAGFKTEQTGSSTPDPETGLWVGSYTDTSPDYYVTIKYFYGGVEDTTVQDYIGFATGVDAYVEFKITSQNWEITDVLVDTVSVGVVDNYTFSAIAANHTIEVYHEEPI